MREPTIARNYAEALFESGERSGATAQYINLIESVAGAIEADERIRVTLESPQVSKPVKQRILGDALKGKAPEPFIRFLSAVIKRGRQGMIGAISREYLALVDVKMNRVHASVTVARKPDEALQKDIADRLSKLVGKTIVPHFRHDPAIIGGVLVRIGDQVMDGSVRRKMITLRKKMLGA